MQFLLRTEITKRTSLNRDCQSCLTSVEYVYTYSQKNSHENWKHKYLTCLQTLLTLELRCPQRQTGRRKLRFIQSFQTSLTQHRTTSTQTHKADVKYAFYSLKSKRTLGLLSNTHNTHHKVNIKAAYRPTHTHARTPTHPHITSTNLNVSCLKTKCEIKARQHGKYSV